MQTFRQHAGTARRYDLDLKADGADHPPASPPTWNIESHAWLDGSPATQPIAEISHSPDGRRATITARARGIITVAVGFRVSERQSLAERFQVVLESAPEVEMHTIYATFNQLAPSAAPHS